MFSKLVCNPIAPIVQLTDTELIGPNQLRYALVIGAPAANRVTLSLRSVAVLDAGINLYPGGPPLVLAFERFGGAVREDLRGITTVAIQQIGIWDILWP